MFEKCGLKDIFYRIYALKWYVLAAIAIIIVVGFVGLWGYSKVNGGASASSSSSQLTYYVNAEINVENYGVFDPVNAATNANNYFIKTFTAQMKSKTICNEIYDDLCAVYSKNEIVKNIGQTGIEWEKYYEAFYTISPETGNTIIIDINAATEEGITVATQIIKNKVEELAASIGVCKIELRSENYLPKSESVADTFTITKKLVAEILIIAIVLVLIVVLGIAIFSPTINRGTDIDEYGVAFLGIISSKKVAIMARIIAKAMEEKGIKKLAVASSLKKNNFAEIIAQVGDEFKKIGKNDFEITFVGDPTISGEAFDTCASSDAVLLIEKRGASKHKHFADLLNLFDNFETKILGGILQ